MGDLVQIGDQLYLNLTLTLPYYPKLKHFWNGTVAVGVGLGLEYCALGLVLLTPLANGLQCC